MTVILAVSSHDQSVVHTHSHLMIMVGADGLARRLCAPVGGRDEDAE
jgi:hypothetical protein